MPKFWHKILFCRCSKKIYIDKNTNNSININHTLNAIDSEKISNELSKSIKNSFDSYLNKLDTKIHND
jgi:hypothetical protein